MRTHSEAFQFEKELEWENPAPGIRRQMMGYDGQLMMVKVEFEKGAVGAMYQHYHSQATYVASGKFELAIVIGKKFSPQAMATMWNPTSLMDASAWKQVY